MRDSVRQKADLALGAVEQCMKAGTALFLGAAFFTILIFVGVANPLGSAATAQDVVHRAQAIAANEDRPVSVYIDGQATELPSDANLSQVLLIHSWERKWFAPKTVSGVEIMLFANTSPDEEYSIRIYPESGVARVFDWGGPAGRETVWYTLPHDFSSTFASSFPTNS